MVINGVSNYAMTGWRIGWAAGPEDLIAALDMLQSQSVTNACSVSQAAALAALRGDQGFLEEWVAVYHRQRRDLALELINAVGLETQDGVGAFYLYVNCSGMIGQDHAGRETAGNRRWTRSCTCWKARGSPSSPARSMDFRPISACR